MSRFRDFVEQNARWFRGRGHESSSSLDATERSLGVALPDDIRWLLRTYGYWHATGISSLEETVADTLECRQHLGLPNQYVVLYNHQDGGVILLDSVPDGEGENKVYNAGWEAVPNHIEEDIVYPSYLNYVQSVLTAAQNFIAEKDVDCDRGH
jgi:hypothetical protein